MNLGYTDEQEDLRARVRRFLAEASPSSDVRRLMATTDGYDAGVWLRMSNELGLQGMLVPGQLGGKGLGFVDLVVALEEMGSALLCAPFFSTVVLAGNAIMHSGDGAACASVLPRIASGHLTATLAFTEDDGRWDSAGTATTASRSERGGEPGWVVNGHKNFVIDGHTAGLLVVTARTRSGVSMFLVDGHAPGVTRTPLRTVDQTRKQARISFAGAPAALLGNDGAGTEVLNRVLQLAAVALGAEQVGGAQRCLDMAVSYAKDRYQFGRPIGSFQAVKHKCAGILLELETARSALCYGAWAAAHLHDELPVAASVVKARCSEAFARAAAANIQIHGGVGFTWAHDAHLYYRRARSSQLMLGDPYHHRRLLARRIALN